jgi:hypothetical protein
MCIDIEQARCAIWDSDPAADVWWGDEGIDALIWPKLYVEPSAEAEGSGEQVDAS